MTTVINPVIWVLAAALLTLAVGRRIEGLPAAFIRSLESTPVLVLLLTASAVNLGARALVGHVAPGDVLQEVAAARSFAERGELYPEDIRPDVEQWVNGPVPFVPRALAERIPSSTGLASLKLQAHPPALLLAAAPLVWALGGRGAFWALTILSVAAVLSSTRLLLQTYAPGYQRAHWWLAAALLLGWFPVLATVRLGQVSVVIGALCLIAWSALRQGRPGIAGAAVGIAVSLKLYPAILLLWLALRSPKALGAAMATIAGIAVLVTLVAGPDVWWIYGRTAAAVVAEYGGAVNNPALLSRLTNAGLAERAYTVFVVLALIMTGYTLRRAWPERHQLRDEARDRLFCSLSCLAVLLSPISWHHYAFMLVLPLSESLARALDSGRRRALAVWCLIALGLSVPEPVFWMLWKATKEWPLLATLASHGTAVAALWLVTLHAVHTTAIAQPVPLQPSEVALR